MEIELIFSDKTKKINVSPRETLAQILKKNFPEELNQAIAARAGGEILDLTTPIGNNTVVIILTEKHPETLSILRHSTSHVLAHAVKNLFPGAKLAIGPAIENGFYYDFDVEKPFTPEDLQNIESEMLKIMASDSHFERQELSKEAARKKLKDEQQTYKLELLEDIPAEMVSFYREGNFDDLCLGPHLYKTGQIKHFKLLSVAGAYWRGDEKNKMLQRIYGTAFFTKEDLGNYLNMLVEAEKRDHRKLGKELGLFQIHEIAGAGLIYYPPKGAMVRHLLEEFLWQEHFKRGYLPVMIPHIAKAELWKTSGHYDYYRENMYFLPVDGQEFVLKPMNCPGHILIYQSETRSYRDLPIKFFELGTVYRYEKAGVLHGLLRVRGFTQDDAHIFCTPPQLEGQILEVLDFAIEMMKIFGFEFEVFLSTRPESFSGTVEKWATATNALIQALKKHNLEFQTDPGAGVFYGPKIDIKMKDALGRAWQGPTIQVDFNNPERFNLAYIGPDNAKHEPVMIHRVVLGSLERFLGALIEHYSGAFPLWLAPVQIAILPIADRHADYSATLKNFFEEHNLRVFLDSRNEKLDFKIRSAETEKIPYIIVVGDKEIAAGQISVRGRGRKDLGKLRREEFLKIVAWEIKNKK